jgi:hypothetical protein
MGVSCSGFVGSKPELPATPTDMVGSTEFCFEMDGASRSNTKGKVFCRAQVFKADPNLALKKAGENAAAGLAWLSKGMPAGGPKSVDTSAPTGCRIMGNCFFATPGTLWGESRDKIVGGPDPQISFGEDPCDDELFSDKPVQSGSGSSGGAKKVN